ncbi:MAG: MBL fold metallo-hydrolase [Pseudomonadota bacterium]
MSDRLVLMGVKGGPAIRPGSNMPTSLVLQAADQTILIDAGLGVSRGLCDAGIALPTLDAILVTHLHSDHYLELGPLLHTAWTCGLRKTIPLIGPTGLRPYWEHFLRAMAFDVDLRIADEGRPPLAERVAISTITEGTVYEANGLTITALRNHHPPIEETFALRFDWSDKRVVFSGDTTALPEMVSFAKGADLLIHEAMLVEGVHALCDRLPTAGDRLRAHILGSHTSAQDVGRIATEAGVKHLALSHFVPDGDPNYTDTHWEAAVRETYSGPLTISRDGEAFAL